MVIPFLFANNTAKKASESRVTPIKIERILGARLVESGWQPSQQVLMTGKAATSKQNPPMSKGTSRWTRNTADLPLERTQKGKETSVSGTVRMTVAQNTN